MIEKKQYKADIINNSIIIPRPSLISQLKQRITSLLKFVLLIIRGNQLKYLLILNKLPNAIGSHQNELIPFVNFDFYHFGFVSNPDGL
jgi:hypothetical protein